MAVVTMKQLLESGVHFGHQTRRWNPKMAKYIYTSRNGIHIIDLQKTVVYIEDMYKRFLEISKDGGKVLFVGTKKQASEVITEEAQRADQFYVSKRWLGGTLTNFKTIRKSIRRLHQIKQMEKDGTFDRLPKKEVIGLRKELVRLESFLGGIQDMRTLPEAVFIIDPRKERNAILEARKLGIPVFGIVDTNCDPDEIDFFIPANDDAIRSIKLIVKTMANAIIEGSGGAALTDKEADEETVDKDQAGDEKPMRKPVRKPEIAPEKESKPKEEKPAKEAVEPKEEKPAKKAVEPKEEKPAEKAVEPKEEKPAKKAVEPKEEKPKVTEVKEEKAPEAPKSEAVDLSEMTVVELKELAKSRNLSGYSKLKKDELIELLKS